MQEPKTISGKALMERFRIDEYGLLKMMKRGLRPYDQSYKQVEGLLKISPGDLKNVKIQKVIRNFKFISKDIQEFIGTYGLPQRTITKAPSPTSPVGSRSRPAVNSLNFSPKKPDWDYWKKLDRWTFGQAVCLICDCDPQELESEDHPLHYSPGFSARFYEDGKSIELRRVYELALNSLEAEVLSEAEVLEAKVLRPADRWEHELRQGLQKKFKPSHFIAWAKNKGISVPDEIKTFKEKETPSARKLPTAKEIKPISSREASENYKIFPQQQLSHIDEGTLDPYERIPGDSRPRLDFPEMPPSDAPDPTVPRYRCLQRYERGRLTVDKLENMYYPKAQVLRAMEEQAHHELIHDEQDQGPDRAATEAQNQEPDSTKQDSEAPRDLTPEAKNDEILKCVTLTVESDNEINLKLMEKPKQNFTAHGMGFKHNTTKEWKALLKILQEGKFNLGFSRVRKSGVLNKEYDRNRKLIDSLNKKLMAFFEKRVPGFYKITKYRVFKTGATIVTPKFSTAIKSKDDPYSDKPNEDLERIATKLDEQPDLDADAVTHVWNELQKRGYSEAKISELFPNTVTRLAMHEESDGRISTKGHKVKDQTYEEPKDDLWDE